MQREVKETGIVALPCSRRSGIIARAYLLFPQKVYVIYWIMSSSYMTMHFHGKHSAITANKGENNRFRSAEAISARTVSPDRYRGTYPGRQDQG